MPPGRQLASLGLERFLAVGAGVGIIWRDKVTVPLVRRQGVFTDLDQNDRVLLDEVTWQT